MNMLDQKQEMISNSMSNGKDPANDLLSTQASAQLVSSYL